MTTSQRAERHVVDVLTNDKLRLTITRTVGTRTRTRTETGVDLDSDCSERRRLFVMSVETRYYHPVHICTTTIILLLTEILNFK